MIGPIWSHTGQPRVIPKNSKKGSVATSQMNSCYCINQILQLWLALLNRWCFVFAKLICRKCLHDLQVAIVKLHSIPMKLYIKGKYWIIPLDDNYFLVVIVGVPSEKNFKGQCGWFHFKRCKQSVNHCKLFQRVVVVVLAIVNKLLQ